ncbi:unnamed protein product [Amoebophrya sp. A25]|nr:unnamed protein product [Amoebophrya sp. A25]|eukprot:GSA25T00024669001.1
MISVSVACFLNLILSSFVRKGIREVLQSSKEMRKLLGGINYYIVKAERLQ